MKTTGRAFMAWKMMAYWRKEHKMVCPQSQLTLAR